jgi:hypothetical protein
LQKLVEEVGGLDADLLPTQLQELEEQIRAADQQRSALDQLMPLGNG